LSQESQATVVALENGKFQVSWPVVQVRSAFGHYYTGRPDTVLALAGEGASVVKYGDVVRVYGTRQEAEAQL
jgi:hypothetical protein